MPMDAKVEAMFASKPPILVEVRFPRMATSPDWYLCNNSSEFDSIWEKLGAGVEVRLHSVWDLRDSERPLSISR